MLSFDFQYQNADGEPVSNEIMVKEASEWEKKVGMAVSPFDMVAFMVELGKYMCKDIDYPPQYLDKGHALLVDTGYNAVL
jgi:hypothetical protein